MRAASNVVLRDMNIVADHLRDVPRRERHLRRLHRLRRDRAPLGSRASRGAAGARRHRRRDRDAGQGGRGRAATVQVRRPVRPRPEPGRDLQAALRTEPWRGGARPDGRPGDRLPDRDARPKARRSSTRSCRRSPQQGRRRHCRARGAGQSHDRRRRRPRRRGAAAAGRRVVDRRRRVGQPRAGLLHGPRPPPDGRGARGAPSEPGRAGSPRILASAMLMVRSAEHGAVVFGPRGARYLDEDRVEGEDPTALFGPHTRA